MAKSLRVQMVGVPKEERIPDFRNFGEEVYLALRDDCDISIAEIDASTTEFHIRNIPKGSLHKASAAVKKSAARYNLTEVIEIETI
ncbi:MAG TPA: hypothetical protein VM680_11495 [Verrucomicrobiae bacterium]|nr:hypothetical protein [Verrucomicrobiae bacterium]